MLEIVWLGQGGYLIYIENKKICIDPYLSNSAEKEGKFARIQPIPVNPGDLEADWLICTHDHIDHLDPETIGGLDRKKIKKILGPKSCITHLAQMGIPERWYEVFDRGKTIEADGIKIEAVFAEHTEDSIGVVITYSNKSMYLTGDTLWHDRLLKIKECCPDILICCINGKLGNMNSYEAAKLAEELKVNIVIPSHYGMFMENTENPESLCKMLKDGVCYKELEFNKKEKIY